MLTGSAWAWLKSLPHGSYTCWEDFSDDFIKNFLEAYKRPASFEQLRACKQRADETLREYIQRWTLLRNSAERISEYNAIYVFTRGVYRLELKETLGRIKPKTIAHLIQVTNEWADGEGSVRNKRNETLEDAGDQGPWIRRDSRNNDCWRKCKAHV